MGRQRPCRRVNFPACEPWRVVGRGRWGAGLSPHFELLTHQTARRSLPLSRPLASTLRKGLREVRPAVGPTPPGPPGPASGHRAGAPWLSTRGPGAGGNGPDPPAQPGPPPAPAAGPHVWGMTSRCSQSGSSRSPGIPWPLWRREWAPGTPGQVGWRPMVLNLPDG